MSTTPLHHRITKAAIIVGVSGSTVLLGAGTAAAAQHSAELGTPTSQSEAATSTIRLKSAHADHNITAANFGPPGPALLPGTDTPAPTDKDAWHFVNPGAQDTHAFVKLEAVFRTASGDFVTVKSTTFQEQANQAYLLTEPGWTLVNASAEVAGGTEFVLSHTRPASTETPGGETPGGETPGGETPGGETPGGETPGGETPGGETPGGETPGGETPGGETPGGETPGGETPGGETPGGETPGGETPGGETPGGETPGGETPGGETPGGETPGGTVNQASDSDADANSDHVDADEDSGSDENEAKELAHTGASDITGVSAILAALGAGLIAGGGALSGVARRRKV